jgi:hypothetical protein
LRSKYEEKCSDVSLLRKENEVNIAMCIDSNDGSDFDSTNNIYKKGKAIPLQSWTGPEGSSRLRFPDIKTIGT